MTAVASGSAAPASGPGDGTPAHAPGSGTHGKTETRDAPDARARLPHEPYPGLRPFLDFEAALLFGRERQVREVIEHLRRTQFVAVLGGSGSGKSSLIHAGVMPELRSYGIPGAGDLWLPMTCTPGTNVSAGDSASRRHTPITRLARRFAQLLRPRGSEAEDRRRSDEIAEVFRQEAGFARLLETYGAELALPAGVDPADARVLFVLDQFEELFHPTNLQLDDGRLMVERVLDHFFTPHERCYVVLTMRSEHLNDCASFLELPDAINKSSYLVRRLDPDELRGAITGPAQRFLRLIARSAVTPQLLPGQVAFDDAVLARLLRDVQAITHDPDHLPLLQHLLARLWEAALARERSAAGEGGPTVPVPARITPADLVAAVQPAQPGSPLDDTLNCLRACVDNWPEALYLAHAAAQREQLNAVFRHLAFKDPNTGLYSQQRIDVDKAAQLLGPGATRNDLLQLLGDGFLGSVDYLFWDDEDPARVTLKVSHESFIRGWSRFRALIDAESAQFNEFLGVLRRAAEWAEAGRNEEDLLTLGELRRCADSGFTRRRLAPDTRQTWRRLLGLDRDGARLSLHEAALDPFVERSQQRLAEQQRHAARLKLSRRLLIASTVLFALLPTALFSVLVQGPTMRRAELLFDAGNRANRATLSPSQARVGDASGTLDSLLRAAERVEAARVGEGSWRMALSRQVLDVLGGWPLFSDQHEFLGSVFMQAEPPVNGTLRQLLGGSVWRAPPPAAAPTGAVAPSPDAQAPALPPGEVDPARAAAPVPPPRVLDDAPCAAGADGGETAPRGRLFVSGRRAESDTLALRAGGGDTRALRALFVPQRPDFDRTLEVFSASVDANGSCTLGTVVLSSPEVLDSRVVIDAGLRYFYYTVQGATNPVPGVVVQEIDWERSSDGRVRALQRHTLSTLTDPAAVAAVNAVVGAQRAAVVPTWRLQGGRRVEVDGRFWRIVASQAQRVEPPASGAGLQSGLQSLTLSPPGSPCIALADSFAPMKGFSTEHRETATHCFTIARGWPALGPLADPTRPARDELRVAVHERPATALSSSVAENPPAPVAGMVPFGRVTPDELRPGSAGDADGGGPWLVGTAGPYAGWLLLKTQGRTGDDRFIGLPWSTCALWRLGRQLQRDNAPPGAPQAGGSSACETQP